ncbi:MAG: NAD-glutamate dehydrogenase [Alphaproteobacteria bacterium]|nr:NAD-glutamate dehydrogenase [Alphaproteobacteria bacterium]
MFSPRQEFLLSAFASYVRQTTIATKRAVLQAYQDHPDFAEKFLRYFDLKFNPAQAGKASHTALENEIMAKIPKNTALKAVFSVLKAMTRTNFYQGEKDYVSFKMNSSEIHHLPKPKPMAEIFVFSEHVDAVHLRFGKIARGGIRWSNRKEDFRTEILSLVKTQQVKNVVIVPVGSKGGFFPKNPPKEKEEIQEYAVNAYKTMMRGLLDITDNIVDGKIVPPKDVVRYDDDDPYLVVAADKGTAGFSNIANALSAEYGFWLGDAFASGGSTGFSHKGMAITAKGSWESVKRHFREMGRDCQTQDFTMVGVGSMAGDVFGNALLCSEHSKLIAAFNSSSIFIDPNPDPAASFKERQRLFKAEAGWADYDRSVLSAGGGIYSRKEPMITISKEACAVLGVSQTVLAPDELIKAILAAPVDLLYFGGIGTYVKSSIETQMDAKDSANAACRIDAPQIRAKVIAEGANLGLTQKARVEYALRGGRLNTDAVDNSGGVDCSDHEVNIKIMLNSIVADKKMTMEERNALLKSMQDEVASLVLRDNYLQTQVLSYMQHRGAKSIPGNKKLIHALEKEDRLNRALESLPTDAEMDAGFNQGLGLTRPALAVLMAYAKLYLYDGVLNSDLPDDPYVQEKWLPFYFPEALRKNWPEYIAKHSLRREISATMIVNNLINRVGVNFIGKMRTESSASVVDIVKAYLVVAAAYDTEALFGLIEAQDGVMPAEKQADMLRRLVAEIENMTLTVLRNGMENGIVHEIKSWEGYKDEKFTQFKTDFSA